MSLTAERPRPSDPLATPGTDAPGGDRFVGRSLLVVAALLVGYQLIVGHVIPPLAVFAVLTTGLGWATLRRRPRWLLIVDGLVAAIFLIGSVPFYTVHLAHPESPVSFLGDAFLIIASLTVIVGVGLRLRHAGVAARSRTAVAAAGVAALAVVVSVVAVANVDSEARQDGDVPLVTDRSVFPAQVEVPAGGVLWVSNQDPFHHTFVVDDTDVHEVLAANSAVRVPVELDPGTYRFWCDVPGHESMEGELRVR